jgi:hypothetical protein
MPALEPQVSILIREILYTYLLPLFDQTKSCEIYTAERDKEEREVQA